jgi:hypothetical protein
MDRLTTHPFRTLSITAQIMTGSAARAKTEKSNHLQAFKPQAITALLHSNDGMPPGPA